MFSDLNITIMTCNLTGDISCAEPNMHCVVAGLTAINAERNEQGLQLAILKECYCKKDELKTGKL